jgi:hypothetical protein
MICYDTLRHVMVLPDYAKSLQDKDLAFFSENHDTLRIIVTCPEMYTVTFEVLVPRGMEVQVF